MPAPAPEQKEQKEPKEKKEKKEKPAKEPKAPKEDGAHWDGAHTSCTSCTLAVVGSPWRRCSGILKRPSQSSHNRGSNPAVQVQKSCSAWLQHRS